MQAYISPKRKRRRSVNSEIMTISKKPKHISFSKLLKELIIKNGRRNRMNTENDESMDYMQKKRENNMKIENQKQLIKLLESNHVSLYEEMQKQNKLKKAPNLKTDANALLNIVHKKKVKYGFGKFNKTNYSTETSMREFYSKFSEFNILTRKYPIEKNTPSWEFIRASRNNKIVPNPLGLIKRYGDEKILDLKNQKVGDNYMSVLSNSLKYSDHLRSFDFEGNRLTHKSISKVFKIVNESSYLANNICSINLSNNNIGKYEINNLINFISDSKCPLRDLNLYGNLLGNDNVIKLCDSLGKYIEFRLNELNLGKNNIYDKCCNSIVNMLTHCHGIRVFIISHNWLHNNSAKLLINELIEHSELKMLDISWNCIGDDLTATPQYEALVKNESNHPEKLFNNFALNETLTTLKLNLRRNPLLPPLESLGGKKQEPQKNKKDTKQKEPVKLEPKKIIVKPRDPSPFAVALGEYFAQGNLSLVHLDISHNNLNYEDCKLLSEKSKLNHMILGIHLDGNEMEINSLGFIIPIQKGQKNDQYFSQSQIYYNMNQDYIFRKTGIDVIRKIRGKNRCWICEGYREVEFEFIPNEPLVDPNNHLVKLHLSFDNYKPFDMLCVGNKFQIVRMCPPGEVTYFFTIDSVPVKIEASSGKNKFEKIQNQNDIIKYTFDVEYMNELNNIRAKLLYDKRKVDEDEEEFESEEDVNNPNHELLSLPKDKITIEVDTISRISVRINRNVITDDYIKTIQYTEPRPEKILNRFVKPRTPWTYPVSIWAYYGYNYEGNTEDYINSCFEFDFKRCQFEKDFKDEQQYKELKKFLRERYRDIIDCYKYYASLSGFQLWQITQNNLTEFISRCPGMCDVKYDINNIFLTQKVVCSNLIDKDDRKKGNKNISDNIIRHQFMNLLVKSAKDKYITVLKTTNDNLEATKMAFEKHYDVAIKGFEYHKWCIERYYNEEMDNFLKAFLPILDGLYLSIAKQKGPRKKDIWMTLDEFNNFIQNIVDINEYPIRENPLIFNQSLRLQTNEIYTDKHINMLLPEFLEALCRAIDKASPIPMGENKDDWPMEKRQNQPLVKKLENILPLLIKLITNPDLKALKEKFPLPKKDLATNLYIINYDNPFYKDYIIKTNKRQSIRKSSVRKSSVRKSQLLFNESIQKNNEEKKLNNINTFKLEDESEKKEKKDEERMVTNTDDGNYLETGVTKEANEK